MLSSLMAPLLLPGTLWAEPQQSSYLEHEQTEDGYVYKPARRAALASLWLCLAEQCWAASAIEPAARAVSPSAAADTTITHRQEQPQRWLCQLS